MRLRESGPIWAAARALSAPVYERMISETLAGTNAGVSEVSLSDTSSSNSNPPNGAIAENRAESPAEAVRASTPAGLAELSPRPGWWKRRTAERSEEHTSELQSLRHLVCRLLLENK